VALGDAGVEVTAVVGENNRAVTQQVQLNAYAGSQRMSAERICNGVDDVADLHGQIASYNSFGTLREYAV
jgi:hypothetical protein